MRYVVTGGAGFIGSNTVDELVKRGHSVVVLDDLSAGKEDNLAEVRNKITFIKGSITAMECKGRLSLEVRASHLYMCEMRATHACSTNLNRSIWAWAASEVD